MNKYLPILGVVVIGLGIVAGAFFFFNKKDASNNSQNGKMMEEDEVLKELPLDERPYVTLTPRLDGNEFHLTIEKIPSGIEIVEYELVYKNQDGVTQGVPGSIKYKKEKIIERDLLLGSCSSGKCKYDEGVETGTFSLKLRDEDGKLVSKMETGFHIQKNVAKLTSVDGKFSLTLTDKNTFNSYYLTMGTFGLPQKAPGTVSPPGPYGVFTKSSLPKAFSATVDLAGTLYVYSNKWTKLENNKTSTLGIFVATQ